MKFVFVDTEFTSLHSFATLISAAFVTLEGEELIVTLNDYDRSQLTEWISQNVLPHIDESQSLSSLAACRKVEEFLLKYIKDDFVSFVSAGKMTDVTLIFQLWHSRYPEDEYFHFSKIPEFLFHDSHFDLNTLFLAAGIDPNEIIREKYIDEPIIGSRHDALYDAKVVRQCFLKLVNSGALPQMAKLVKRS